jgi:peptidyl-prolyl cis-trans isomerase D
MFDFVRTHNRILQVVLGLLIIPSFAIFGIQGYTHMMSENSAAVASVDGKDISIAEWDAQQRRALEQARERNPNLDPKEFDTPEAKRAALDTIIRDRVMQAAVFHQNLESSEERVALEVQKNPDFAQIRAMTPEQREAFFIQRGMTPNGFMDYLRDTMARTQALRGVATSSLVPAVTTKAGLDAFFDKREIQWQRFDTKDYAAAAQPTDAQIQAWYDDKAHTADFLAPEEAKIDYVVLDIEALKAQINPSQAELQAYYDKHKTSYTAPEERHVSHIFVAVDPKAPEADRAKAKARAEELLAEVRKNPATFADVAKRSSEDGGTKANGGDLDWVTRDTFKGALGDAVFALKQGEIGLAQSGEGYHVIEVTGIRGGGTRPLAEVQGQIADALRTEQAQKKYADVSEKFTNAVYEQPDSLDPVMKELNLQKQSATVKRTPAPDAIGPLASKRLLDAVFAPDALNNKHNTEAIETARSQLVSAHVVSYQAAHRRPLAEVHDQIVAALRSAQATAAARKDGTARLAAAQKDAGLALPLSATVGRAVRGTDVPRQVTDAALKADITKGPVVTGVELPDGGYAVVRVVKDVPRAADDAESAQAKDVVANNFEDAESQALFDALKARYKTKIDEERLAHANAAASSPK